MTYRQYVLGFLGLVGLGLLSLLCSWGFLWRAHELAPAEAVAQAQAQQPDLLYGTALNQNTFRYKVALYAQRQPEVLVLGSSRVMQFRQQHSRDRLMTAGGAGSSLDELELWLSAALPVHVPRVVVLGVDFWWFHPAYLSEVRPELHGDEVTKAKLVWLYQQLKKRQLTLAQVEEVLRTPHPRQWGLNALLHQEGYRADGSWRYDLARRARSGQEFGFAESLARLREGHAQFLHGSALEGARVQQLDRLVQRLRARGIEVVLFQPPLAAVMYGHLQSQADKDFAYVSQLDLALQQLALRQHVRYLNLRDPHLLGATACDFVDGYHGGDVLYGRIFALLQPSRATSGWSAGQGASFDQPNAPCIAETRGGGTS